MLIDHLRKDFDRRYNRINHFNIHPEVINWKKRATNNGGTISNKTLVALDWFYRRLKRSTCFGKILLLNCIVPDNFKAALTPLIDISRQYRWTSNGILASSLNIDGIFNNGGILGGNYISTGFVPSNYLNANSGGITFYASHVRYPNSLPNCVFGSEQASGETFQASIFGPNSGSVTYHGQIYSDGISSVESFLPGYYSFNRLNSAKYVVYRALSPYFGYPGTGLISHYPAVYNDAAINQTPPNVECYFLALHNEITGGKNYTDQGQVFSFFAAHRGLTLSESLYFSSIIELFRIKLGGGFGKFSTT